MALALGVALIRGAALGGEAPSDQALSVNPKLSVIGQAPDFTLLDTAGNPTRLSDLRGRVVLLAFVFTKCVDACPLISRRMAALQGELKKVGLFSRKADLLSVTVDPDTDTAEVLAKYARKLGADPAGWKFLRDAPARMRPIYQAYDEWSKKRRQGDLDHPARVYLIDPKGRIREIYSLAFFNERQALIDIKVLVAESERAGPR